MSQSLYLLAATCLIAQAAPESVPQAPVTKTFHGVERPLPPLPMPTAAPWCLRFQATTQVWLQPIPMPLDIIADPVPGPFQRWHAWKACHRKAGYPHPER